jgi:hypothetical protein
LRLNRLAPIGFFGVALALTGAPASALPLVSTPAVAVGNDAQLIPVRGGCGYGEHRGPLDGCRINNGPRGAIRAATTGLPGGCPPGLHRGAYGRCRRF